MDKGFAELDGMIERLRSLPNLAREAAPDVAAAVEDELERTIKAGTSSEGQKWQPRQDGGQPLKTAGKSLVVTPYGTKVIARLRGHVARHHRGIARGGIERPILPQKGIPPAMAKKIKDVLAKHFTETMGG